MPRYTQFHIHGDNIVECERTLALIIKSLKDLIKKVTGPLGSPVCPEFKIFLQNTETHLHFIFYPGFNRWDRDILEYIQNSGGVLREAADAIITGVNGDHEEPLLAIEYCGALPAGNQAWQRNGRAFSIGMARIPYLIVTELGGYELDENRIRKAPRMPNPAVPFSFLSYSLEQSTPVLPVYITSPGADEDSRRIYANEFADSELVAVIRAIIFDEDPNPTFNLLNQKVLSFTKIRASASRQGRTLTAEQWNDLYRHLQSGNSLVNYIIENVPLRWSKVAYISDLTITARTLMDISSNFAIGLTSSDLPLCVIPGDSRPAFAFAVSKLYPNLNDNFLQWLSRVDPLVVCWVMGFKPRGDDARPDRGLPPLARMLIGHNQDLLTIIYGPAPTTTWPLLINNPLLLIRQNGLWESILTISDSILIDSSTDRVSQHGYLRNYWQSKFLTKERIPIFVKPLPSQLGENDVDTVLHSLFSYHAGSDIFECMCNPPGGDWSGISLYIYDRSLELRWLSLPRVSGDDTKRPDHVFQLFKISKNPIILSIESKENAGSVESHIGPRLSTYLTNLISSPASVERSNSANQWHHSTHNIDTSKFTFASATAFISANETQITAVKIRAQADLVMVFSFKENGTTCEIRLIPTSFIGEEIASFLHELNLTGTNITIIRN